VYDEGLHGLIKKVGKDKPEILDIEVPKTLAVCRVCRILRFPDSLKDVIQIGGGEN
jgi:hypothetical protein